MPNITQTVRTLALADGTVAGLIGLRMYPSMLPQRATLPAASIFVVDTLPTESLAAIADISRARIQISCYAKTYSDANDLGDAVRLALEKHRGTTNSQYIREISLVTGEQYVTEEVEAGTDQARYVSSLDFHVHYVTTTS